MSYDKLVSMLKLHEGFKPTLYRDTVGKYTAGYGHNFSDVGLTEHQAESILFDDIAVARAALVVYFTPFQRLDEVRQAVLIDMCLNMGWRSLSGFKKFLGAVAGASYETAAAEMLASLWARQVGDRAVQLAGMMQTGRWPS